MVNEVDKLLYGKGEIKNIVCIEPLNESSEIFTEVDGKVSVTVVPHKYWLITPEPTKNCLKLEGNLHFQYGNTFKTIAPYLEAKQRFYGVGYNISNLKEAQMIKDGYTYYQGMTLKDVSVLSFDIETTSLSFTPEDRVILISTTFRNRQGVKRKLFAYDEYPTQAAMLEAFCDYVREINPSIILGYNILGFDLPYLRDCARFHSTTLKLGRDGSELRFSKNPSRFRKDQSQFLEYTRATCYGREIIDCMFLSIKYDIVAKKYPSYRLKEIIRVEGLEDKDRVFYDASQIRFKYTDPVEFEKIKAYCIFDSDDCLKLWDLMGPSSFYLAQILPMPLSRIVESATGSQLNSLFVRSYLQERHSIPKADEKRDYPGAISFGLPGIYSNVLKLDFASLYPSIMLQYEVYPRHKDPKGNILKLLDRLTAMRLEYKRRGIEENSEYFENMSNAMKVLINSAYGLFGANGLNFNYPDGAAEVTKIGRGLLKDIIHYASGETLETLQVEEVGEDDASEEV